MHLHGYCASITNRHNQPSVISSAIASAVTHRGSTADVDVHRHVLRAFSESEIDTPRQTIVYILLDVLVHLLKVAVLELADHHHSVNNETTHLSQMIRSRSIIRGFCAFLSLNVLLQSRVLVLQSGDLLSSQVLHHLEDLGGLFFEYSLGLLSGPAFLLELALAQPYE